MSLIKQIKLENTLYDIGAKWSNIDKENIAYGPSKIINFEDNKIESLKKCIIDIKATQEGDGDPSPENIRLISGQTKINIIKCAKNLVYFPQPEDDIINGISISIINGELVLQGTATANTMPYPASQSNIYENMPLGPYPAGTYQITCSGFIGQNDNDRIICNAKYQDGTSITGTGSRISATGVPDGTGQIKTFTAIKPFKLAFYCVISSGTAIDCTVKVQMTNENFMSEYQTYNGENLNIILPSEIETIYGGTLNITNGLLTITHGKIIYNGSETWTSLGEGYYRPLSSMKLGFNNSTSLCDKFPFTSSVSVPGIQLGYNNNSTPSVYIRQAETLIGVKTADELKSWLAANPVEVVYPLAEPITYQLTPQIITSLIGWNNIWANCGDISIELENFYSDIQTEITTNLNENTLLYKSNNSLVSSNILIENDNLYFSKLNTYSPPKISVTLNSDNETYRNMDIGWSYNLGNGAVLGLREEHFPTTPGAFFLCARRTLIENENTSILTTQFRGTPDGSITISNDDYTACLNINTSTSATINPKDYNLYVNGTSYLKGDTKISANTSTVGCTLQYNNTLNTLNFVFD